MKTDITGKKLFWLILAVFCCLSPLYGQRAPINVNLIIDGSAALSGVKDEVTVWVNNRLEQILTDGDRVTVWSAGPEASIIYSGVYNSGSEKEALRGSIQGIAASGSHADFSGALRAAAGQQAQNTIFTYTLLISASPEALTSVLESPQAGLLRFSRVEEFSTWRALVVGLNLDTRVRRAASSFMNP